VDSIMTGLCGVVGTITVFAFCAYAVWIDYRKKKDESEANHRERMKALEMGCPPLDGEIARAKAYASAAWAAGIIGLVVPFVVVSLTVAATIVAVLNHNPWDNIAVPLIVAWSIAAVLVLVVVVRSLNAIRQLPRPTGETRPISAERQPKASSMAFQEIRPEL
jgi:succinate dehydrogenase/fumarate reductase cytochrome b subunit